MVDRIEGDTAVSGDEKGLEGFALSKVCLSWRLWLVTWSWIWLLRRRAGKVPVRCLFVSPRALGSPHQSVRRPTAPIS